MSSGVRSMLTATRGPACDMLRRGTSRDRPEPTRAVHYLGTGDSNGRTQASGSDRPGEGWPPVAARLRAADAGGGADGADGDAVAGDRRGRDGAAGFDLQADQARRRRAAEGVVVAGPDAAQSAFRHRHQGPGRLAAVL